MIWPLDESREERARRHREIYELLRDRRPPRRGAPWGAEKKRQADGFLPAAEEVAYRDTLANRRDVRSEE